MAKPRIGGSSAVTELLREYAAKRGMGPREIALAIDPNDDGTLEAEIRLLLTEGPTIVEAHRAAEDLGLL